jgi:hypothetical protein
MTNPGLEKVGQDPDSTDNLGGLDLTKEAAGTEGNHG